VGGLFSFLNIIFKRGVWITGSILFSFPFVWAGVGGFILFGICNVKVRSFHPRDGVLLLGHDIDYIRFLSINRNKGSSVQAVLL